MSGEVGTDVPITPAVRLKDRHGNPVPGAFVRFQLSEGGGQYASGPKRTDSNGEASGGRWILGTAARTHTVTVSAEGLTAVVFATDAKAGAAAAVVAHRGSGQSGAVGTTLPEPLVARVGDVYGNAISGATVNFEIVSGGGAVSVDHAVTDENGVASVAWTLGADAGPQWLRARHADKSAEFSAHAVRIAPPCEPTAACDAVARLAFSRLDGIHLVNVDGSNPVHVTGPGSVGPAWSPDRARIAFTRGDGVYTMNADGSNVVRHTGDGYYPYGADWAPDGRTIAFAAHGRLYVISATGNGVAPAAIFSRPGAWSSGPSWSPDGTQLAFVHLEGVHLIKPDGTGLTRLPSGPSARFAGKPDWSPDGRRIAVVLESDCDWDDWCDSSIAVMDADGSNVRIVATGTRMNPALDPAWSSDGSWIAFTELKCVRECAASVGVVRPDGSGRRTIISDGAGPAWRP